MSVAASSKWPRERPARCGIILNYKEMERFCVNCVMSNWLTITLLELCVIIFNTGMYALAWRLAKAKCQSCHVIHYNLPLRVRDPIRAIYSSKRRPTSVVVRDFQALFENCLLLVTLVISLHACDFSSCRVLFFFKCRIASSPVFRQTTLTC